jgi:hypothetical protein
LYAYIVYRDTSNGGVVTNILPLFIDEDPSFSQQATVTGRSRVTNVTWDPESGAGSAYEVVLDN